MAKRLRSTRLGHSAAHDFVPLPRSVLKKELKDMAVAMGLNADGKKAELLQRVEEARMAEAAKPKRARVESPPVIDEDVVLRGCLPRKRETLLLEEGKSLIFGVDEAGRGPLAGPVVAAACAMPLDVSIDGINDSKQTIEEHRELLYDRILEAPGVRWAVAVVDHERIDDINIFAATMEAMAKCCRAIMDGAPPSAPADISRKGSYMVTGSHGLAAEDVVRKGGCYALIDGNKVPSSLPCRGEALVKGDGREYIIAAASILAKVTRDRLMVQYDAVYPAYGFAQHKAYGVAAHMAAIKAHGPCPIHRRSFAPMKNMTAEEDPLRKEAQKQNPFTLAAQRTSRSRANARVASFAPAAADEEDPAAAENPAPLVEAGDVSVDANTPAAEAPSGSRTSDGGLVELFPRVHESWRRLLEAEASKPYFAELDRFVTQEQRQRTVYPPKDKIFRCLEMCPLGDVKVVVLGQDPYHQPHQAHGLSFSVEGAVAVPPSLRNIYKELRADLNVPSPRHGNLEAWAAQGVLLLNTVLTVRRSEANSHHKRGWEAITDGLIKSVSQEAEHVVFLLWGKPAQTKAKLIDATKHRIIMTSHPSPLSASRATKTCPAFLGSRCFSQTNKYLEEKGRTPISWKIE